MLVCVCLCLCQFIHTLDGSALVENSIENYASVAQWISVNLTRVCVCGLLLAEVVQHCFENYSPFPDCWMDSCYLPISGQQRNGTVAQLGPFV